MRKTKPICYVALTLAVLTLLLTVAASARDDSSLKNIKIVALEDERQDEIGATVFADMPSQGPSSAGGGAQRLLDCMESKIVKINRNQKPSEIFTPFDWSSTERDILDNCNLEDCKYEFPKDRIPQLMEKKSIEEKKDFFFKLIFDIAIHANKAQKTLPISKQNLAAEPCAKDEGISPLLEGPVQPRDSLTWTKFKASQQMRPTTMILQVNRWRTENTWCMGKALLFSTHYYSDHVELFQVTPGNQTLQIRYHVRSRLDFFRRWLARQSKWVIRNALKDMAVETLKTLTKGCAAPASTPPSK